MTKTELDFLSWLEDQESHYIEHSEVESEFPELEFDLTGITVLLDPDGDVMVPKRDYRQAIKYGQVLD